MKKIKRLELRTGQVLNPLQQGFVVGGKDDCNHQWVDEMCDCTGIGDTHDVRCTKTVEGYFVTLPNLTESFVAIGEVAFGIRWDKSSLVKDGIDRILNSGGSIQKAKITHYTSRRCNGSGANFMTHDNAVYGRWDRIDYL